MRHILIPVSLGSGTGLYVLFLLLFLQFLLLFLLFLLSFPSLLSLLAGNIRHALRYHAIDHHAAHGKKKQDAANLPSVHVPILAGGPQESVTAHPSLQ